MSNDLKRPAAAIAYIAAILFACSLCNLTFRFVAPNIPSQPPRSSPPEQQPTINRADELVSQQRNLPVCSDATDYLLSLTGVKQIHITLHPDCWSGKLDNNSDTQFFFTPSSNQRLYVLASDGRLFYDDPGAHNSYDEYPRPWRFRGEGDLDVTVTFYIEPSRVSMRVGEKRWYRVYHAGNNVTGMYQRSGWTMVCTSENSSVASTGDGYNENWITARSPGITSITCSYNGFTGTVTVSVNK